MSALVPCSTGDEGCTAPAVIKGLCNSHYQRQWAREKAAAKAARLATQAASAAPEQAQQPASQLVLVWPITGPDAGTMPTDVEARGLVMLALPEIPMLAHECRAAAVGRPAFQVSESHYAAGLSQAQRDYLQGSCYALICHIPAKRKV